MKGEVVKGVLKKHGVNIRDLAARLGMTNQNVSQLLGKDDIKTGLLERISDTTGIDLSEFYGKPFAAVGGNNFGTAAGSISVNDNSGLVNALNVALEQNNRLLAIIEKMQR